MLLRELKINLKTLILYTVILSAMFVLIFSIYPSLITDDTKLMLDEMMKTMPEEMLASFNMDIIGIEDAYGWFKTEGYVFLVLIGAVYASILGATILIKEENDKTIEFLYSKPINRKQILTSKIICGLINILLFTLIVTLFNFVALKDIDSFDSKEFFMISLSIILVYYLFFFTLLFISTFYRKTKKSMATGIAIVFVSYAMQLVGGISEKVEILKKISYFEFSSSRYIVLNNSLDTKYIIAGIAIILICILGTYYKYDKKEFI